MRSAATFLLVGENPTAIKLSDIKQTAGEPGDLTLCTYNDNVTRLAQYIYVSAEAAAEAEIDPGWYILDGDGNPDVEAGVKEAGHLHPGLVGPVQSLPPPPLQSRDAEVDAAPGRQLQGRVRAGGRRQTIGAKRMDEIGHGTRDEFAETQARLIYGDPPEAGTKTEEVTSC